jgi:hypothetical protein
MEKLMMANAKNAKWVLGGFLFGSVFL